MIPSKAERFRGMMPIMPTAIDADGRLDESSQRRLVEYCLKCGAAAIGHFGIASEYHKVSDGDRTRLIELIVEEVDHRVPVFIGVTSPGQRISLEYGQQAEQLGADLIMAALPSVDLPDADGAYKFYSALSRATSLPIIIQDTPSTSSILSAELLWRMYGEIDNVQHVKAEGKNFIEKVAKLLRLSNGDISVIGGAGGRHLIQLLHLGVTAFMTGTEALDLHAAAVDAFQQDNDDVSATIYYEQILPYLEFYLDYSEELLKRMLYDRGVIDCPDIIAPRAAPAMSEAEREAFDRVLDRISWRKKWPDIP